MAEIIYKKKDVTVTLFKAGAINKVAFQIHNSGKSGGSVTLSEAEFHDLAIWMDSCIRIGQ